jgi:hypothetical protein
MTLILILLVAAGVIWFAERSFEHLVFAVAAFGLVAAVLLLVLGDLARPLLLSTTFAAAVFAASEVKHRHSGLKLIVTDLPLLFAGTVPFFFVQYPLAVAAVLIGGTALILVGIATVIYLAAAPLALGYRVVLFAIALAALAVAWRLTGGAAAFHRIAAQRRCFYSAFMASLLDPFSWRHLGGLDVSDMARDPLPLLPAIPARSDDRPDIIVIQHESIFDPRVYGLPVEPTVEGFLSPKDGVHGHLNVDIFGGGSWQTEFSLLTGLSSSSFGSNAYFLFTRGAGRFHSHLPQALSALGYRTMLASSCRRNFLNYETFYRAIGVEDRVFSDDYPAPFELDRFESTNSDAMFLPAAFDAYVDSVTRDPSPRFLYVLTNFNHGPHSRRLVEPGCFESERAFAAASLGDAEYAEYYARLAETAASWAKVKSDLSNRLPRRPMLVVRYGDHQPVMVRRIEAKRTLPIDSGRLFRTFYAMEMLNAAPGHLRAGPGPDLDIAFLGTVALQQAGLPLDQVFATRASLLAECGASYFTSTSERKRRFHRTLVEHGLIDLAPRSAAGARLPGSGRHA